jgi:hypothetical protein
VNATYATQPRHAAPSPQPRQAADGVELTALHTAIRFSGLFAKFTAQRWGFHHLTDTAERIAIELIARAVETPGNPNPHPCYSDLSELHIIGIRVSVKGSGLLIEVWDCDPSPPQDSSLDSHLPTVEEISQGWSCYRPRSGEKVIWAVPAPRARSVGGVRPPHRQRQALHAGGQRNRRLMIISWPGRIRRGEAGQRRHTRPGRVDPGPDRFPQPPMSPHNDRVGDTR